MTPQQGQLFNDALALAEFYNPETPDINPTMVGSDDPNLGANAINRLRQGTALELPGHTGHPAANTKGLDSNAINQPSTVPPLNIPKDTAHRDNEKPAVTHVFEWGTDYRKNYEKAYGAIPAGSQIHHLTPRAVYGKSPLAQEWSRRGITGLDYPENLEALPQTKDAYDKSDIRIQHSGFHANWNNYVTEVLGEAQTDLIRQYGTLDKVPDDVMKQRKNEIMQELRDDLHNKDLGIEEGWIKHMDNGMDKLSEVQPPAQIG